MGRPKINRWNFETKDNKNVKKVEDIWKMTPEEKKMRSFCKNCIYYDAIYSNTCDYLLITGEMRGCHYGEGCTKKVVGKSNNRIRRTYYDNE